MKQIKSTIRNLLQFVLSDNILLVNAIYTLVLLASIITLCLVAATSSFMLTFCAGVNTMLVCLLIKETKDLINEYRWYFGIHKNNKKKNTKQ